MDVKARLFALQDEKYRAFQCALMPTVDPETVIGVRTPQLRKLARELAKEPDAAAFLAALPHRYYEENNLHAFMLETIADFETCAEAVHRFLPYVDNWATCDGMNPKAFAREAERLLPYISRWLNAGETYTVRYALVMLMKHFMGERFDCAYLERAAAVRHEDYYVRMAVAWYFATALTYQYEAALPYIEQKRLDTWTHNKAIQKAMESLAVPQERKKHLRTLRIR